MISAEQNAIDTMHPPASLIISCSTIVIVSVSFSFSDRHGYNRFLLYCMAKKNRDRLNLVLIKVDTSIRKRRTSPSLELQEMSHPS